MLIMKKNNFKNTGTMVSLLGFGCMRLPVIDGNEGNIDYPPAEEMIDYAYKNGVNYFDTAYVYHKYQSEVFAGKVLSKYPRESYFLADKMPPWKLRKEGDLEKIFDDQLEKLGTDYIDFYLIHSICTDYIETLEKFKVYDFLSKKKEQGLIKNLGFSFHDTPDLLVKYLDEYAWDFVQIQLNYLDWELLNSKRMYEELTKRNIPVVVMEPVRGGALSSLSPSALEILKAENPNASAASWAMRFIAELPNVLTILSGMSTLEQVVDNINTLSDPKPFSAKEKEALSLSLEAYKSSGVIGCTGCGYCMDCPQGVDIPRVFSAYNQYRILPEAAQFINTYQTLGQDKQAAHCTSCMQCTEVCPQSLEIPALMAEIDGFYQSL